VWKEREMPVISFSRLYPVNEAGWRTSPRDFCWGKALPDKYKYVECLTCLL